MATGLNNGVYDTTQITPPPAPNYSLSAFNGTDPIMGLHEAGTWDGHQVVGVLFDNATTYYSLSTITISDGLLGSDDTVVSTALPGGSTIYLITTDNYGIPFTVTNGNATHDALSGQNIAVGPNRRRKYHLGYI